MHKQPLLQALEKEIGLKKNYLPSPTLSTIYFGGGTPSLLEGSELQALLDVIRKNFSVDAGAEITLEANPDDVSAAKVSEWKNAGINRLSIGIQSFFEEDLVWMNRAHNAQQAENCIDIALQSGIENITADLIYGFPLLTDKKWEQNMLKMLDTGITHLSAYSLTVEAKTALAARIKKGQDAPMQNGQSARHFLMLMDAIANAGWQHYEISNYCKPGNYALHNTNYWKNRPYIGIGPSAHSYNGSKRQWNVANNAAYIAAIESNEVPAETEELSMTDLYNEYVMTGLRTQWGIDIDHVKNKWGEEYAKHLQNEASKFIQNSTIIIQNNSLRLSRDGKLLADYIASELFWG